MLLNVMKWLKLKFKRGIRMKKDVDNLDEVIEQALAQASANLKLEHISFDKEEEQDILSSTKEEVKKLLLKRDEKNVKRR